MTEPSVLLERVETVAHLIAEADLVLCSGRMTVYCGADRVADVIVNAPGE